MVPGIACFLQILLSVCLFGLCLLVEVSDVCGLRHPQLLETGGVGQWERFGVGWAGGGRWPFFLEPQVSVYRFSREDLVSLPGVWRGTERHTMSATVL